jgi:hypothetical protein
MACKRSRHRKGKEFFYLDKDGKRSDALLHEDMLAIPPEVEKKLREQSKQIARECGLSEEAIARLYPDE